MATDKTPITPAYLSLRDAALYSGISIRGWHYLFLAHQDAPRRIQTGGPGGKILLKREDIDNFLDALKREPDDLVAKVVDWASISFNRKGSQN